jgi:hypothetical protein
MCRSQKGLLKVRFKDADNLEKLRAQKGLDDSQVWEEVYQIEVSFKTGYCKPALSEMVA